MDPVTHFLTGACLSRSGFNRKTAYATLAMTLAAEAPDMDVLAGVEGPVTGFCHHRGITHTLVGAPVMALAVTGTVWMLAAAWRRLGRRPPVQPVRWGWLYGLCLIADLSHLLLDYTNSYGLRPFFPFNPHWYAWSIVSIFEPVMFVALLLALMVPGLLGLVEGEMRRRQPGALHGRGWAIAALTIVGLLYGLRQVERTQAMELVRVAAADAREAPLRVAAEPVMGNPFTWHTLAEMRDSYALGTAHTASDRLEPGEILAKPQRTPATELARASYLGRVYQDWSSWPVIEDVGARQPPGEAEPPGPGARTVLFRDLRYAPASLGALDGGSDDPVLSGWVTVGADGSVLSQWMSGREQR